MSHYFFIGGGGDKIVALNCISLILVKIGLPLEFHFRRLEVDRLEDEMKILLDW